MKLNSIIFMLISLLILTYRNKARVIVDADTFFSLVTTTSVVKAEGTYDNTSILVDKLQIIDCGNSCL